MRSAAVTTAGTSLDPPPTESHAVERAIDQLRASAMVIVIDERYPRFGGHLVVAADCATPEALAFMVRHTSGFVTAALTEANADRLVLPPLAPVGTRHSSDVRFAVSVDAREGISTGISATDRAHTIRLLADRRTQPADLTRPGHIVPVRAHDGGVLRRRGAAEAAVDLARFAGLEPAAGLCQLVSVHTATVMADADEAREFADEHGLTIVSIDAVIAHRRRFDKLVKREAESRVPLSTGALTAVAYRTCFDEPAPTAFVFGDIGDIGDGREMLVRVHSGCLTGDIFRTVRCACGRQLESALAAVATAGRGVILYVPQRIPQGAGSRRELLPYGLHATALTPIDGHAAGGPPIDEFDYEAVAHILDDLGVRSARLLSNSADEQAVLERHGVRVTELVPLAVHRPAGIDPTDDLPD